MTLAIFYKLLAIFVAVLLGWAAGRARWLGPPGAGSDPARVLGNAAFYIFVPALLFRTTARIDFAAMPWRIVLVYFLPVVGTQVAVYALQRWRLRGQHGTEAAVLPAARTVSCCFGNGVQLGIPLVTALYGEAGLGIHIAVVSLHAMILLTVATVLVEVDLAREAARQDRAATLAETLRTTLRNTLIHPVVLPVLAGMAYNATGLPLPAVADEALQLLASGVVPLCLVLIGLSLAYYGLSDGVRGAVLISTWKLLGQPALVLVVAHWGFGLSGLPLSVLVMMAALPTGSNALIFAQRYGVRAGEATAAIVFGTVGFMATAPLWIGVVALL
ncbi:putative permease [Burkholderiales bacterium JOSHI_001]|nr:putative permease [Burkholderiales bacterium JOSHI_001]